MKARVLALALVLASPSLAHAGWFNDTIGRPIAGGLGLGWHLTKDSIATGARQTSGAFGSAARGVGLAQPRSDREPPARPDGTVAAGAGKAAAAAPASQPPSPQPK